MAFVPYIKKIDNLKVRIGSTGVIYFKKNFMETYNPEYLKLDLYHDDKNKKRIAFKFSENGTFSVSKNKANTGIANLSRFLKDIGYQLNASRNFDFIQEGDYFVIDLSKPAIK